MTEKKSGIKKWQIVLLGIFLVVLIIFLAIPKHKVDYLEGGATYTTDIKDNQPEPQPEPTPQTTQYTYHANDTLPYQLIDMGEIVTIAFMIGLCIAIFSIVRQVIRSMGMSNYFPSIVGWTPAVIFFGMIIFFGISLIQIQNKTLLIGGQV